MHEGPSILGGKGPTMLIFSKLCHLAESVLELWQCEMLATGLLYGWRSSQGFFHPPVGWRSVCPYWQNQLCPKWQNQLHETTAIAAAHHDSPKGVPVGSAHGERWPSTTNHYHCTDDLTNHSNLGGGAMQLAESDSQSPDPSAWDLWRLHIPCRRTTQPSVIIRIPAEEADPPAYMGLWDWHVNSDSTDPMHLTTREVFLDMRSCTLGIVDLGLGPVVGDCTRW